MGKQRTLTRCKPARMYSEIRKQRTPPKSGKLLHMLDGTLPPKPKVTGNVHWDFRAVRGIYPKYQAVLRHNKTWRGSDGKIKWNLSRMHSHQCPPLNRFDPEMRKPDRGDFVARLGGHFWVGLGLTQNLWLLISLNRINDRLSHQSSVRKPGGCIIRSSDSCTLIDAFIAAVVISFTKSVCRRHCS